MAKIDLSDLYLNVDYPEEIDKRFQPVSSPVKKDFFLFMLGTDTTYVDKPTHLLPKKTPGRRNFKRGDTLSFSMKALAHLLGEEVVIGAPDSPLCFSSDSIAAIAGPSTLGSEVGDRIAKAIYQVILAAARGYTHLSISAFSRGAVEAILLMHELDRIKCDLKESPEKSLFDILVNSPCIYTQAAVKLLYEEPLAYTAQAHDFRRDMSRCLETLTIDAFLIDPVPGDAFCSFAGWTDPRFGKKLPCQRTELLVCRDERTTCFVPIIPEGVQPTIIPGHHGTACGNPYDQQGRKPWKTTTEKLSSKGRTTTVQDLVVCKLFHFWEMSGVTFEGNLEDNDLEHAQLSQLLNNYLKSAHKEQEILKHYNTVYAHNDMYRQFAEGSYNKYLGRVQSKDNHRLMHYHHQRNISMSALESMSQQNFVNTEHATLYLDQLINTFLPQSLPSVANQSASAIARHITHLLANIVSEIQNPSNPKLQEALKTKDARMVLFDALSMRAELISRKYLRNHLPEDEKIALMEAIEQSFAVLSKAEEIMLSLSAAEGMAEKLSVVNECKSALQSRLKQTVEAHYQWLEQESKQLTAQIQLLFHPEGFQDIWTTCLHELNTNPAFVDITNELMALNPVSMDIVTARLMALSDLIETIEQENDRAAFQFILTPVMAFINAYKMKTEDYLHSIERFYDGLHGLDQAWANLNSLVGTQGLNFIRCQPRLICLELEKLSGQLLKETGYDLRKITEGVSPAFYSIATRYGVAYGAESIEFLEFKARFRDENNHLHDEIRQLQEKTQQLEQQHQAWVDVELTALKLKTDELAAFDNSPQFTLIADKLLALTEHYLTHLLKHAKKYNGNLNITDFAQILPENTKDEAYLRIKCKFKKVQELRQHLINPQQLPGGRVRYFSKGLATSAPELHRDSAWLLFTKMCLVILGSLVTGIVPALVYAAVTKKSPLFFARSQGEQYAVACQESLGSPLSLIK
jgi:hypothetical protein